MRFTVFILAFPAALAATIIGCCKTCPPPEPDFVFVPPLDASTDGPLEDPTEAQSTCGKACANLRKYGCPEGHMTPAGSRCYDICKSAPTLIRAECVASALTKEAILRCSVRCR